MHTKKGPTKRGPFFCMRRFYLFLVKTEGSKRVGCEGSVSCYPMRTLYPLCAYCSFPMLLKPSWSFFNEKGNGKQAPHTREEGEGSIYAQAPPGVCGAWLRIERKQAAHTALVPSPKIFDLILVVGPFFVCGKCFPSPHRKG